MRFALSMIVWLSLPGMVVAQDSTEAVHLFTNTPVRLYHPGDAAQARPFVVGRMAGFSPDSLRVRMIDGTASTFLRSDLGRVEVRWVRHHYRRDIALFTLAGVAAGALIGTRERDDPQCYFCIYSLTAAQKRKVDMITVGAVGVAVGAIVGRFGERHWTRVEPGATGSPR